MENLPPPPRLACIIANGFSSCSVRSAVAEGALTAKGMDGRRDGFSPCDHRKLKNSVRKNGRLRQWDRGSFFPLFLPDHIFCGNLLVAASIEKEERE